MKKLLPFLLALLPAIAFAQVIPSIPYTFTNGSVADATQVNSNFSTIQTDVNANAATSGANTNITSITGLTTPLANTYGGTVIYTGGTSAGTANAQTLATVTPSNFALTAGNIVTGTAGFTNTGATTLVVNGTTATAVDVNNGAGLAALTGSEIVKGNSYTFFFDGAEYVLINPSKIANALLASSNNNTIKSNISGGSATPSDNTMTAVLDAVFTSAQGSIIFRSSGGWTALTPGTSGQFLQTQGAGANPQWSGLPELTSTLTGDVTMSTQNTYYDGPGVAQGSTGTWCASTTVTIVPASSGENFYCKLWDGTTVADSFAMRTNSNAVPFTGSLSGCISSPAGNIKVSCTNATNSNTGQMVHNFSGNSKDTTITATRVQ